MKEVVNYLFLQKIIIMNRILSILLCVIFFQTISAQSIWSENFSDENIQLRSRYWNITDGNGNVEEIRGHGVVGKQPFIKSGDAFEYTSYCPLPTNFGVMHGYFEMVSDNGKKFKAKIDPFRLSIPHSVN